MCLFNVYKQITLIVMAGLHTNSIPCNGPLLVIKYIFLSYLILVNIGSMNGFQGADCDATAFLCRF